MKQILPLCIILFCSSCAFFKGDDSLADSSKDTPVELTAETKALYNNLKGVAQKGFLFGHQDAVAYGIGWWGGEFNSDVEKVSGDYPAVFGWDIGHIDSTRNLDSVSFEEMHGWIEEAYDRGAVITIGWHQRNLATGGDSWDNTPVIEQMLAGGELNSAFTSQLDKVADFFSTCQTSEGIKIPIIFRPYHEHNGGWFWWGNKACPDELYKKFWIYTYNYLRINKKVDNVLFAYSTDAFNGREDYLSRYPGDDYVDILGWDDYKSIKTIATRDDFHSRIKVVNELAREKDKVASLSETGLETIPVSDWWTNILLDGLKTAQETDRIAYVLVWRNARTDHHYAPYPDHPSVNDFIKFKNDTCTLFLSDIPNMY